MSDGVIFFHSEPQTAPKVKHVAGLLPAISIWPFSYSAQLHGTHQSSQTHLQLGFWFALVCVCFEKPFNEEVSPFLHSLFLLCHYAWSRSAGCWLMSLAFVLTSHMPLFWIDDFSVVDIVYMQSVAPSQKQVGWVNNSLSFRHSIVASIPACQPGTVKGSTCSLRTRETRVRFPVTEFFSFHRSYVHTTIDWWRWTVYLLVELSLSPIIIAGDLLELLLGLTLQPD